MFYNGKHRDAIQRLANIGAVVAEGEYSKQRKKQRKSKGMRFVHERGVAAKEHPWVLRVFENFFDSHLTIFLARLSSVIVSCIMHVGHIEHLA